MPTTTHDRIIKARIRLLMTPAFSFWGSLAMQIPFIEDPAVKTAETDGTCIKYSPAYIDGLSDPELAGLIAHEISHCAMGHIWRMGNRDVATWNEVCDCIINPILTTAGLTLPAGALFDTQLQGMSAEAGYAYRNGKKRDPKGDDPSKPDDSGNGAGDAATGHMSAPPTPQPSQPGDGNQPGDGSGDKVGSTQSSQLGGSGSGSGEPWGSQADWEIATQQANMVASKGGVGSAGMERASKEGLAVTDWKSIIREFLVNSRVDGSTWNPPNRRFVHQGLYLPGPKRENAGTWVVAVDTSGSIGQRYLDAFGAELALFHAECKPEQVTVMYCDTKVHRVETFGPEDEIRLSACGGGGTYFQPVFSRVDEMLEDGTVSEVDALIYLTDLECADKPTQPDYPVLWGVPVWCQQQDFEWGRVVPIDPEQ